MICVKGMILCKVSKALVSHIVLFIHLVIHLVPKQIVQAGPLSAQGYYYKMLRPDKEQIGESFAGQSSSTFSPLSTVTRGRVKLDREITCH